MSANILKKKNLEKYSFFYFIVHCSKAIESNLKYRCEYLNGILLEPSYLSRSTTKGMLSLLVYTYFAITLIKVRMSGIVQHKPKLFTKNWASTVPRLIRRQGQ